MRFLLLISLIFVSPAFAAEFDVDLQAHTRVHFNTNVSDFVAARAFYGQLGFETLSGFPDTNTQAMARAIGVETPTVYDGSQGEWAGGYLLHGELIGLGGFGGGLIDLIEFTIPRNEAPPYSRINHLGMAKAAMHTRDINADYAYMQRLGVEFLAPPVRNAEGALFAIFTDLDGTFYELLEVPGEKEEKEEREETETTHIFDLGAVTINVANFERSAAWYGMLGYEQQLMLPETESLEASKAMGFATQIQRRGARFVHPEDGSSLEIVQWIQPFDAAPPYPIPVNHVGIHRMAFSTSDIESDVAKLQAQGVEMVSPVTPCCSGPDAWGSIIAFYDPDGVIVELVEQPLMDPIIRFMRWVSKLFS